MADSPTSYARYAGTALFPRTAADLRSTVSCPACFTALRSVVCGNCGLDLTHDAAAELALVSSDVAGLLDERIELIGRIRFDSALAARRAAVLADTAADTAAASAAAVSAPPAPRSPVPGAAIGAVTPSAPVPAAADPAAPARPPVPVAEPGERRSSVQVALIIIGVSLVSVAAVYFLVYAFINYGLVWRSVIIGAITVAAFVVASALRRKRLASTAEGIGAFAVVLVYLDAFAIRANDLFGAASGDALVYWGATLVASAAVFAVWHRVSALRVGAVAAAAALAPGVGLLVAGVAAQLDGTTRLYAAFLAVSVAGLAHPFVAPRGSQHPTLATAERAVLATFGAVGLVVAFFAGWEIARVGEPRVSYALWAVALVSFLQVAVLVRAADTSIVARVLVALFSATAGLALTLAPVVVSFRLLPSSGAMIGIALAPTTVVLLLALLALRATSPLVRPALRTAAYAAAAVAASMALIPAAHLVVLAVGSVTTVVQSSAWSLDFRTPVADPTADTAASAIAIVLMLALVAAFGRLSGTSARLRRPLVWTTAASAVVVVPLLGSLGAITIGWLAEAAACVAALVWVARRADHPAPDAANIAPAPFVRPPLALLAGVTVTLAYVASWASLDTWALGTVATVALLVVARRAVPGGLVAPRAALLALAVAVALGGAAAAGYQFGDDPSADRARAVAGLAVLLLALSAIPLPRVSAPDRRTVFALAAAGTVLAAPFVGSDPALSAALLVAVLAWILPTGGFLVERRLAAFGLAPAAGWLLTSLTHGLDRTSIVVEVAPIAAALLAAGGSLALAARTASRLRLAGDLGVALVALSAVVTAVLPGDTAWLVLLVAAATVLVTAISPDGLFAAISPRKHLGWGALALATLALWRRLDETSVTSVEAYVLPLAGALLAIAALDWRARRAAVSSTAPALVLAALLVAVVPVALSTTGDAGPDGSVARAVLVGAVSAALLLAGSVVRAAAWTRPYLDASAVAGAAGVVLVAVGRCLWASPADATADAWLAAALVVFVIAAFGQCSGRPGDRTFTPRAGGALAIAGLTLVVGVEATLLDSSTHGFARTLVAVVLFAAVHVVGQLADRLPFDRLTGWVALAYTTIVAVLALATGSVPDVEWVSVPLAASLLVAGGARLVREASLRSTRALGGGLVVLFLPSLLESSDGSPVWRLVAVGVLAVAAVVIALVRRLQAPFVVGGIVAVVHGLTTFAPQILAVYESTEWWVWAGAGGIVVLVLGARYERSLRTAKSVVASIGNLR